MFGQKKLKRGLCSIAGDIIHRGHINFIAECASRCNYLIVAIPTDECIEKYKGEKPIMTLNERSGVIKAIKEIKAIIWQESFEWKNIIELLAPDIVFDSEEHRGKRTKADVYIPVTEGISSTIIKERIRGKNPHHR